MTIDKMRTALAQEEVEHIQSLSSKNLFHYAAAEEADIPAYIVVEHIQSLSSKNLFHHAKDTVIAKLTDAEVAKQYSAIFG